MRWSGVRIPGGSPNEKDAEMRPFWLLWRVSLAKVTKKREKTFVSFSFGDKVVDEDPEGFGGCAKRKRLRQ